MKTYNPSAANRQDQSEKDPSQTSYPPLLEEAWSKILRIDKVARNFKAFYRRVEIWHQRAPLDKWAREDLKEMLDDHREVK